MERQYGYWILEIKLDETTELYKLNDYSKNKIDNQEFISDLTMNQKKFFEELKIDLNKIEIDKKVYDINKEGGIHNKITRITINFLIKGEIIALPKFQKDIYSDNELMLNMPKDIKTTTSNNDIVSYEIDGMHIVFKHPYFHFENEQYKKWGSGYILGSILKINEE